MSIFQWRTFSKNGSHGRNWNAMNVEKHALTRIPKIDFLRDQMGFPSLLLGPRWFVVVFRVEEMVGVGRIKLLTMLRCVYTLHFITKLALLHLTIQASRFCATFVPLLVSNFTIEELKGLSVLYCNTYSIFFFFFFLFFFFFSFCKPLLSTIYIYLPKYMLLQNLELASPKLCTSTWSITREWICVLLQFAMNIGVWECLG